MSRNLTTDDIKTIYELVGKLSPEWTDAFAVDDSEGAEKPKKLTLAQLKALFTPYNGATNDVDLGDKIISARKGLFGNIVNNLTTTDDGYIADARQLKVLNDLITALKGVGWTDETLASLGLRLTTLEGSGTGSVQEQIQIAIADLAGAGRTTETVKGNADAIALRELSANKVTAFQETPDDTHYPSEKLVDDSLEAIKGVEYTGGTLKSHEDRLDTLESDDTTEGSVLKAVKDVVDPIDTRLTGLDTLTYEGITYMVSRKIENGHLVTVYTEVA